METKKSLLSTAERTRLAKMRFFSENVTPIVPSSTSMMARGSAARRSLPLPSRTALLPDIDISIPGVPVSSRYVMAMRGKLNHANENIISNDESINMISDNNYRHDGRQRETFLSSKTSTTTTTTPNGTAPATTSAETIAPDNDDVDENPFTIFLNSMNKLKAGNLKDGESKDILGLLIKMENVAAEKDENKPKCYGYSNVGTYNGGSNLRINPVVQRSYVRRLSLQNDPENESSYNYNYNTNRPASDMSGYANKYRGLNGNEHFVEQQRQRDIDNMKILNSRAEWKQQLSYERTIKFQSLRDRFERKERPVVMR